jgi:hypothetical protein
VRNDLIWTITGFVFLKDGNAVEAKVLRTSTRFVGETLQISNPSKCPMGVYVTYIQVAVNKDVQA